jgi:DNA-binding NarL/FixJ family response regulator
MHSPAVHADPILIVDDDPAFRSFVRELLERAGWRVTEAEDGEQALADARGEEHALVVLDIGLPGISGLEVCYELRQQLGVEAPIVFVSGQRTESIDRVSGLLLGGDDYLVKPFDPDELLARVRAILRRTRPGDESESNGTNGELERVLTRRELEVLRLLARGLTQPEIARELVISPRTVGSHIQNALAKLDVHSRAQAVALVHRAGLA